MLFKIILNIILKSFIRLTYGNQRVRVNVKYQNALLSENLRLNTHEKYVFLKKNFLLN